MVTCKKCLAPNFDLLTLVETEHIMCPRCQAPAAITEDLIMVLTDLEKITKAVIPTLGRHGIIPAGPLVATWRLPIAADVQIVIKDRSHLSNQLKAFETVAPNMATRITERMDKIEQNARETLVGISHTQLDNGQAPKAGANYQPQTMEGRDLPGS